MTRFLVGVQLPRRLALAIRQLGIDAGLTLDLPNGNRPTDVERDPVSPDEHRVVTTMEAAAIARLFEPYDSIEFVGGQVPAHQ